jgi:REP-associated tyrosine transposase
MLNLASPNRLFPKGQFFVMSRHWRLVLPGCPHHVLQRGNRKNDVFGDDTDRLVYLRLLKDACKTRGVKIWAYCLMWNHVHHIMVPEGEHSISLLIQDVHGEYSRYLNKKYGLVGHAWHARFKCIPLDEGHCYNAIRYVERNPVRAGMVKRPESYAWSSAGSHCGVRVDLLVSEDCPLIQQIENWSDWLNGSVNAQSEDIIRRSIRTGTVVGSDEFIARVERLTGRRVTPVRSPGRPRKIGA